MSEKEIKQFMDAVRAGNLETCTRMYSTGRVKVNDWKYGGNPWSAIMWASRNGRKEIIDFLIKCGANLDEVDMYGNTALMWASHGGHVDAVRALLVNGAKIDIKNNKNQTALDRARARSRTDVIELLEEFERNPITKPRQTFNDTYNNHNTSSSIPVNNIMNNSNLEDILELLCTRIADVSIESLSQPDLDILIARSDSSVTQIQRFLEQLHSDKHRRHKEEELEKLRNEFKEKEEHKLQCVVCLDKIKDTAFFPCGHLCCCEECSDSLNTCPICRNNINDRSKIYIS